MTGLREEKRDEAELSRDRRPAGVLPDLGGEAALLPGVDAIAVARDGVDTVDSKEHEIVANIGINFADLQCYSRHNICSCSCDNINKWTWLTDRF